MEQKRSAKTPVKIAPEAENDESEQDRGDEQESSRLGREGGVTLVPESGIVLGRTGHGCIVALRGEKWMLH